MRIAHVQHPYVPNLGYQENHLPAEQGRLGHDVHVVTSDFLPAKFRDGTRDASVGTFRDDGVPIHRLPVYVRGESIDEPMLKGLHRVLEQIDPDVIHSHGLIGFIPLQTALHAWRTGTDLFYDVHVDNDNFHLDTPVKRLGFALYRRGVLRTLVGQSNAVMAVNPLAREFVERELGVPEEKLRLLPLGVDTDQFYPNEEWRHPVREELGLDEEFLFVFAGNVEPRKDIEVLLSAFGTVCERHDDVRLLVVGGGEEEYLRSLEVTAEEEGVASRTTFLGAVPHEDLPRYYNAADAGVWPGKLGVAIIEALGTGLPIAVCESRATSFLTANDNGLTFERGNADELAERLLRYVDDPALLASHAERSAALASEELSWRGVARRSIEIYRGE